MSVRIAPTVLLYSTVVPLAINTTSSLGPGWKALLPALAPRPGGRASLPRGSPAAWPSPPPASNSSLVSHPLTNATFSASITCSRSASAARSWPQPDAFSSPAPAVTEPPMRTMEGSMTWLLLSYRICARARSGRARQLAGVVCGRACERLRADVAVRPACTALTVTRQGNPVRLRQPRPIPAKTLSRKLPEPLHRQVLTIAPFVPWGQEPVTIPERSVRRFGSVRVACRGGRHPGQHEPGSRRLREG
jgi:hypothetical protein